MLIQGCTRICWCCQNTLSSYWWLPSQRRFPLLMIAPEGTTKSGHCLLRFSTGAFVPGASPCKSAHGKVTSV
jgi:hypothetical protein